MLEKVQNASLIDRLHLMRICQRVDGRRFTGDADPASRHGHAVEQPEFPLGLHRLLRERGHVGLRLARDLLCGARPCPPRKKNHLRRLCSKIRLSLGQTHRRPARGGRGAFPGRGSHRHRIPHPASVWGELQTALLLTPPPSPGQVLKAPKDPQ